MNKKYFFEKGIAFFNILLILFNPLLGIYFSIFNKNIKIMGGLLVLISSLILLSKFNINISGDDTFAYINTFLHLDSFSNVLQTSLIYSASFDPLFWYPVFSISLFTDNVNIFLFICHFFALLILYYSYYKIAKEDTIFIFVLLLSTATFYYLYGNAIRQAFVVSLSVLFLYYLIEGENKKALLLSVITIFVHPTGILLVVVWIFSKINIKYIYILLLFSFILQFFPILNLFGHFVDLLGLSHIANKAIGYSHNKSQNSLFSVSSLLFFFVLFIYLIVKKYFKEFKYFVIIKVYFIYEAFYLIFLSNSIISNRIFSFRGVLDGLVITLLLSYFKQKKFLKIFIVGLFFILNILNLTVGDINNFLYMKENNLIDLNIIDLFNLIEKKLERF